MAYRPQAPPLIQTEGDEPDVYAGSTISEKAVTPVTAVTEILSMPLSQFAKEDRAVQVRVPGLEETLWFVPRLEHIGRVMARGVHRGRIWTAGELTDLMKIGGGSRETAVTLARIKM